MDRRSDGTSIILSLQSKDGKQLEAARCKLITDLPEGAAHCCWFTVRELAAGSFGMLPDHGCFMVTMQEPSWANSRTCMTCTESRREHVCGSELGCLRPHNIL